MRAVLLSLTTTLLGTLACEPKSVDRRNNASATATAASAASATAQGRAAPPVFLEGYEAALSKAKQQNLPLFVDAWAPWCHTCISMKEFAFKDAALHDVATKFVWAAVDTERETSAAFLQKFPMDVWPTLWVIDPKNEKPLLKWPGAATASELVALLKATVDTLDSSEPKAREAWTSWQTGNEHVAAGRRDAGIAAYEKALNLAPPGFPARAHVVEALVFQLQRTKRTARCVEIAAREVDTLPPGTSRLNTVLTGLSCAGTPSKTESTAKTKTAKEAETTETESTPAARARLLHEGARMAAAADEPVLADDRSSLFQALVFQHANAGDADRATVLAKQWSAFLDDQAVRAQSPGERVVFDYHRLLAYEQLGELHHALAMLEQSERDFPDDYNAPSRLAKVQQELGHLDAALAAVDRALTRVYGPRTLRVLRQKADILTAMKQPQRSKQVLESAIALGEQLGPLPEGYQRLLDDLKRTAAAHEVP